jgi:hypothetical protein
MSDFIQHLAGVAQITRDILKFVSDDGVRLCQRQRELVLTLTQVATSGSSIGADPSWEAKMHRFNDMLIQWRAELPTQLKFEAVCLDRDLVRPNSWISRHRSSLLVRKCISRSRTMSFILNDLPDA